MHDSNPTKTGTISKMNSLLHYIRYNPRTLKPHCSKLVGVKTVPKTWDNFSSVFIWLGYRRHCSSNQKKLSCYQNYLNNIYRYVKHWKENGQNRKGTWLTWRSFLHDVLKTCIPFIKETEHQLKLNVSSVISEKRAVNEVENLNIKRYRALYWCCCTQIMVYIKHVPICYMLVLVTNRNIFR